jgi:cation/acetate symporter
VNALVPMQTNVGNATLNITIFAVFVLITLAIVLKASRRNATAADYYAGG